MRVRQTHWTAPAPPPWAKLPQITPHPKVPHQQPFGAAIEFQTSLNQCKVKMRTKNLLPIVTVTSRWQTFIGRKTMTHNMWSCAKICPRARARTAWSLRYSFKQLCRYMMMSTQCSTSFQLPEHSSPTPAILTQQILQLQRLTQPKPHETMEFPGSKQFCRSDYRYLPICI